MLGVVTLHLGLGQKDLTDDPSRSEASAADVKREAFVPLLDWLWTLRAAQDLRQTLQGVTSATGRHSAPCVPKAPTGAWLAPSLVCYPARCPG